MTCPYGLHSVCVFVSLSLHWISSLRVTELFKMTLYFAPCFLTTTMKHGDYHVFLSFIQTISRVTLEAANERICMTFED